MKKIKLNYLISRCGLLILFFIIGLSSCQKSEELQDTLKENFVNSNSAEDLVGELYFPENDGDSQSTKASSSHLKKVESITCVPGENGNTVYYIINYENGGFLILSADNRIHPVLAFSASSNFPVESGNTLPNGLVEWLFDKKEEVEDVRRLNQKQTEKLKKAWTAPAIQNFISGEDFRRAPDPDTDPITDPDDPDCPENTLTIVGPLINTTWGQGDGYNDLIPVTGCSNYLNGRAPTGCVATAMAQIMRYHEYPSNYDWGLMPNTSGSNATAQLMLDIGYAVGMDWGCGGSSADTEDEVASSFRNDFGYSSASYADFNHSTVQQQLRWNRPVILRGGRNTGWWIFGVYSDGHAWVCDGYREYRMCMSTSLFLHMNWGWGIWYNYLNGWYAFNNWNPGDNTFNYKKGMVYNIAP
jgi:hypothetical protein